MIRVIRDAGIRLMKRGDGRPGQIRVRVRRGDLRMSGPGHNAIVTRDLSLWYGAFQALIDVSVELKHGLKRLPDGRFGA